MKNLSRLLILSLLLSAFGATAYAADHGDAPGVRLQNRLDIADVYIFQSPTTPANTVMIMTSNPASGILSPTTYFPGAKYEFVIDQNGDAKANKIFTVVFGKPGSLGGQRFTLSVRKRDQLKGTTIATGHTGATPASITGGGTIQANVFDDPFFFDLIAFKEGLSFSSTEHKNFFHGLNVNAIVMEMPSTALNGKTSHIGLWCRTILNGVQIDRMGRPAINTVLVKLANKDKFNLGQPDKDRATFGPDAITIIESLGSSPTTATALADTLFPDILTFDTSSTAGFLNGRKLDDDVIDAELNLLSSGGVTTDFVDNDSTFTSTFPYLQAKILKEQQVD